MADSKTPLERAMTLAAVSGLKATLGPALLETSRRTSRSNNWVLAALGEMALDKVGLFTRRYRPMLMVPHALAGAYAARESMRRDGVADDRTVPIMGAVVAAGVASVAPIARMALNKGLGVNDAVIGLAEDYLALKFGGEAVGLSIEEMGEAAKEAISDLRDKVAPDLEIPALPGSEPDPIPSHI
ncbi:hypothetical protein [Paludisphaera rhizosphaerae]|uniref:hypothetical protein n=1 Tax=Paludisphaera rhizosphaerae TaxID=2711216 RepID=UPI0013EB358E|nr:hypothetical protein [Paludisphaera rhizosphaerae]